MLGWGNWSEGRLVVGKGNGSGSQWSDSRVGGGEEVLVQCWEYTYVGSGAENGNYTKDVWDNCKIDKG